MASYDRDTVAHLFRYLVRVTNNRHAMGPIGMAEDVLFAPPKRHVVVCFSPIYETVCEGVVIWKDLLVSLT
jgi:hypothetical protein